MEKTAGWLAVHKSNAHARKGPDVRLKNGAPGAPPGRTQRPRPVRPLFERVTMPKGDAEPTLWWDSNGNLFHDEDCTKSAGLLIVRPRIGDDDE